MAATSRPAAPKAQFRLLGFPVRVRYGFVVFMILLAVVPRGDNGEFGIWLAGSVAVFTLLHELGHALVARRAGAEAEISLEFMAGYTSYGSKQPISRPWTIGISLAGPLTHIACGCLVLVAMGANPFDHATIIETAPRQAVWWAGPIIGLFNLVPILPLDGGHVVETVLDRFIGSKSQRVMVYASLAITLAALASTPFFGPTRGLSIFIGFLLVVQLAALFEDRNRHARSPFDVAAAAARRGDLDKGVRVLERAMRRPTDRHLVPKELTAAPDDALRRVIAAMSRPLPLGEPWNEYVLTNLLIAYGSAHEAAEYAAASYAAHPAGLSACGVARAAASLGDAATAAAWLREAVNAGTPRDQVKALVNAAPEFARVRADPAVRAAVDGTWAPPTVDQRPAQ
jgi:Zn-dependent protease